MNKLNFFSFFMSTPKRKYRLLDTGSQCLESYNCKHPGCVLIRLEDAALCTAELDGTTIREVFKDDLTAEELKTHFTERKGYLPKSEETIKVHRMNPATVDHFIGQQKKERVRNAVAWKKALAIDMATRMLPEEEPEEDDEEDWEYLDHQIKTISKGKEWHTDNDTKPSQMCRENALKFVVCLRKEIETRGLTNFNVPACDMRPTGCIELKWCMSDGNEYSCVIGTDHECIQVFIDDVFVEHCFEPIDFSKVVELTIQHVYKKK